ncbi:hypothetical protein AB0D12_36185 [Streptomyces sp. NPDC048479]|uniref:hypothetical protein n=1 Tax=Streptomyces sp. NPDC048479 TaxID=3154725 RepID=UPI00342E79DC
MAKRILDLLDSPSTADGSTTSSAADGHTYLQVEGPTSDGLTLYARLAGRGHAGPRPMLDTAVVLTLAGSIELEAYRHQQDVDSRSPQYVRSFPPETAFAAHAGTLCTLQSSADGVQLIVTDGRLKDTGVLPSAEERRSAVRDTRKRLAHALESTEVRGRGTSDWPAWLDAWPPMNVPDVRSTHREGSALLQGLDADRGLLTRLVHEIEHDPARLAGSRVTLLLDRLAHYQAPKRGFEVRLNMNPRRVNQEVPHNHSYNFVTRILTGGYVHVVRRRTDCGEGEFGQADLLPSIVAIERPGASYTLGHPMVHQALMLPGTVTLFVRGPRLKSRSHALADLMPSVDTWPAPAARGTRRRSFTGATRAASMGTRS